MVLCCGLCMCSKLFIHNYLYFVFYQVWRCFFDLYMWAIIKYRIGAQLFCQIGSEGVVAFKSIFEDQISHM